MLALMISSSFVLMLTTNLRPASGSDIAPPSCGGQYGCISSMRQSDCPSGQVLVTGASLNGCCPSCRGGQGYMKVCNVNVASRRCAPGLRCDRKCLYDQCKCSRLEVLCSRAPINHLSVPPICQRAASTRFTCKRKASGPAGTRDAIWTGRTPASSVEVIDFLDGVFATVKMAGESSVGNGTRTRRI